MELWIVFLRKCGKQYDVLVSDVGAVKSWQCKNLSMLQQNESFIDSALFDFQRFVGPRSRIDFENILNTKLIACWTCVSRLLMHHSTFFGNRKQSFFHMSAKRRRKSFKSDKTNAVTSLVSRDGVLGNEAKVVSKHYSTKHTLQDARLAKK